MTRPSAAATRAARRLWARDAADPGTPGEVAADAERVTGDVRTRLIVWIGSEGYHLLLQRALAQAGDAQPALHALSSDHGHVRGIPEAVRTHGPAKVADGIGAMLAALIDRLGRVVGAEMAERLVEPARGTEGVRDG